MQQNSSLHNKSNEEITVMKPSEPIGSVRLSSNEKGTHAKSGKPSRQSGSYQNDINYRHKPWPSRKANEVEEVVKHMSNVPSYLQHVVKGETVQEKALNIGVLDWQSLEKWRNLQKQDVDRNATRSSSTGNRRTNVMKENKSAQVIVSANSRTPRENSADTIKNKVSCQIVKQIEAEKVHIREDQFEPCLEKKRCSLDSATPNDWILSPDNREFCSRSFPVHYSYAVPTHAPSETKQSPTTRRRDLSPHRLITAGLGRLRGLNIKDRKSYSGPISSSLYSENLDVLSSETQPSAVTGHPKRDLSPHRLLTAGLNMLRSNSARESSSRQASVTSPEDNADSNNKSRRSPLRRMFDPLLKSRNRNIQFSGPVVSLASHQANEITHSEKLPIREELQAAKGINDEPRFSVDVKTFSETSTRRAVLKLAWKNGLPLFMFSTDSNDVLAATVGKREPSEKNGFECFYTIFTAHEVKKKGGVWMSQGNKNKKNGLVYNVVGHIKVSRSNRDTEIREFVLFGPELVPTRDKSITSRSNSELAAILIQDRRHNSSGFPSIVAVLPKGVHGVSSECEPSPLIERWRSRGSCDCGGWDEGCILTVLTEGQGSALARDSEPDGNHETKLFTQISEGRVNKHAFRMDTFEEGAYTVDFRATIAPIQAFAVCVTILHCRKSTNLSGVEAQNVQEDTFLESMEMVSTKTEEENPAAYVPERPPSSPVCRV